MGFGVWGLCFRVWGGKLCFGVWGCVSEFEGWKPGERGCARCAAPSLPPSLSHTLTHTLALTHTLTLWLSLSWKPGARGCARCAVPWPRSSSGGKVQTKTRSIPAGYGHLKPSRPRLVPARQKVCTSHVHESLSFPKKFGNMGWKPEERGCVRCAAQWPRSPPGGSGSAPTVSRLGVSG